MNRLILPILASSESTPKFPKCLCAVTQFKNFLLRNMAVNCASSTNTAIRGFLPPVCGVLRHFGFSKYLQANSSVVNYAMTQKGLPITDHTKVFFSFGDLLYTLMTTHIFFQLVYIFFQASFRPGGSSSSFR